MRWGLRAERCWKRSWVGTRAAIRLAEMAEGKLRNKIPELQQALEGRVTAHHRFLLRELLDHLYSVESKSRARMTGPSFSQ